MRKLIAICAAVLLVGLMATPAFASFKLSTSKNLTGAAWAAFTGGAYTADDDPAFTYDYAGTPDYDDAIGWAEICTLFYSPRADVQKTGLADYPAGTVTEVYAGYWALNDVGTCYYILGDAYRLRDGSLTNDAKDAFHKLVADDRSPGDYFYAQCADATATILWKPADAAYARLLGFTGDEASSAAMTVAAWEALGSGKYSEAIDYAEFCIALYKDQAEGQKSRAQDYHDSPGASTIEGLYNECYAYCDVASCWFIKAEALRKGKIGTKADCITTYQAVDSAGGNNPAGDNLPYGRSAMDGAAKTDLVKDETWKISEAADDRIEMLNITDWNDSRLRY